MGVGIFGWELFGIDGGGNIWVGVVWDLWGGDSLRLVGWRYCGFARNFSRG